MRFNFTRFFPLAAALVGPVIVLSGCARPLQLRPDPLADAARATGIAEAIHFQNNEGDLRQESVPSLLKMQDAIRLALRADPEIQSALARVRVAEAEADQAALLPNPILSVLFRFPERSGKPVVEADLAADLVSILQRPGRIEASDSRLRAASAEAIKTVLDLVAEVQERYVSVQSLDALAPVLDERRNLLGRLLKLAQDRLKQGEGTNLDVTILNAQRLDLEVEIAEKKLQRRQERLSLSRLLGDPSGAAGWQLTPMQQPVRTIATEEAWITAAVSSRPEMLAQKWELAALGVEVRLARFAPFEGLGVGAKGERDNVWSVGPAVTTPLPIFDWGQAKQAKAKALRIEAGFKLTKVRRQIIEEVRKAYETFGQSLETAALVRNELLPAQELRRTQAEAAYRTGQTDITALILAEQDLQATKAKLIDLEQKTAQSLVQLERAVGGAGVASPMTGGPSSQPSTQPSGPAVPATSPSR